ncbi:MAG: GGDEF domain-containing protein [Kangiellaceae bacterium]
MSMKNTLPEKVIGLDDYRHNTQQDSLEGISKLSLNLQQSIELSPLLQTFCEQTAVLVPCDSVSYINEEIEFSYQAGQGEKHHCKYRLVIEGEKLGELLCTRKTPFTIRETELLEQIISLLIYPLRNSLLYHRAIAQAHKDPLTQIFNRTAFDEALDKECHSYRRHKTEFALMMIDIDFFKNVNDKYGHIAGDKILQATAETIQKSIRRSDEVYRYGGEEFVVILSNTSEGGAQFIAERVRKEIKKLRVSFNRLIKVTASIGVCSTENTKDVNLLLNNADKALYQSKASGRNRVTLHS